MYLHEPIKLELSKFISHSFNSIIPYQELFKNLINPPDEKMGDFAFGCFLLAKALKKPPVEVAKDIQNIKFPDFVDCVDVAGPYVNIKIKIDYLGENLLQKIIDRSFFNRNSVNSNEKIMIEYSQPNTHKEIHVGHMRNVALGSCLVRVNKFVGQSIISSTFPGDVGTHVAKCLWYLKFHNNEPVPKMNKGQWLGRLYSAAHNKLEAELGTSKESENRAQLTEILKQLEHKSGEFYDLWKQTRVWSVDLMSEIYQWAGVQFDQWYWESEVDTSSVQFVKKLYHDGKLIESQGAIGMDLESEKLGFFMLLKSDGNGLYATKDLELARRKFEDFNITKSVYIVDLRQALHFKQLFKGLEKLGFEKAKHCFHLQYNYVELPDGAMSSRKGNIVPLTDLIQKMQDTIKKNYLVRYENDWSTEEVNLIAAQVAKGAIFYGMLRQDPAKKIVFDMEEWLKLDGESGPFIQYSCARIKSLLKKFPRDANFKINWSVLSHTAEKSLIQHFLHFHTHIDIVVQLYKPTALCTYLFSLAQKFNYFYHECSIGNEKDENLKQARLALSEATFCILEKGLDLLGVPVPEKM